jgi:hypothetical protein
VNCIIVQTTEQRVLPIKIFLKEGFRSPLFFTLSCSLLHDKLFVHNGMIGRYNRDDDAPNEDNAITITFFIDSFHPS